MSLKDIRRTLEAPIFSGRTCIAVGDGIASVVIKWRPECVYNAILEARLSTLPHSTDQQNVMKLLLFLAASVSAEDLVSAVERVLGSLDGTTFGDPFVRSKL